MVGNEFRSYLRVLERGRMHILTLVENERVDQDSTAVLHSKQRDERPKKWKKRALAHKHDLRLRQHTNFVLFRCGYSMEADGQWCQKNRFENEHSSGCQKFKVGCKMWSCLLFAVIMPQVDLLVGSAGVVVRSGLALESTIGDISRIEQGTHGWTIGNSLSHFWGHDSITFCAHIRWKHF